MNYRKKPVVIEAMEFDGWNHDKVADFCAPTPVSIGKNPQTLIIPTLEGDHMANKGDWIIKGIKGEFYPCKPDIFAATYEPAVKTIELKIEATSQMNRRLRELVRSGLYGTNVDEAARRLVEIGLRKI